MVSWLLDGRTNHCPAVCPSRLCVPVLVAYSCDLPLVREDEACRNDKVPRTEDGRAAVYYLLDGVIARSAHSTAVPSGRDPAPHWQRVTATGSRKSPGIRAPLGRNSRYKGVERHEKGLFIVY